MAPSLLAAPFEESDHVAHNSAAHRNADEAILLFQSTAVASPMVDYRGLRRSPQAHSDLPSAKLSASHSFQGPTLKLPARPPNEFRPGPPRLLQQEDVAYFARRRNVSHLQNLFVKKGYTREEDKAATDDRARRQLCFTHKMSALGEHYPAPVYVDYRSIYGDKILRGISVPIRLERWAREADLLQ